MTDQTVTLRIRADASGVSSTMRGVAGDSAGLSNELTRLRSGALGVAAALGGFAAIRSVARDIVNTTNSVTGLGQAMTASLGPRAAQETAFVRGEIDRLGLEVLSTSGAYSRLAAATQGTILAGQATRDTFTSVAQAARVLNLSAEQTEGTLRALEQMISKGTVQSEELKGQLGERLPGAFRIAAEAMGVTQGELNKLLDTGKVTAEELLPRLSQRLDELYGAGARAAAGLPAADFARLGNAVTVLEAAIGNAGFMTALAQGATGLTTALRDLVASGAIETIASGVVGLATAAGITVFSRLAQGSTAYMASLIQARAAQSAWAEMAVTTDLRVAASSNALAVTNAANQLQAARAAESRAAAQLADINRTMEVVQAARAQETAKLSLAAADQAAAQRTIAATSSMATLSAALRANEDATDRLAAARARLTTISTELAALGRAQSGVLAQQTSAQIALATAQTASATAGARQAGALAASTAAQEALAVNTAANGIRMGALATGMGLVATAGRGLFALMGGWVTVALGAAYGVYYLATRQTEAEKTSESLAAAIDKVRSSTGAMRDEAIGAAAAEVKASEMRIAALEREIDVRARRAGQGVGQFGEMQDMVDAESIDSATTALAQLRPALQEARAEFELAKRGMTLESATAQLRTDVTDMVASIDRFVPAGSVLRAFGIEIDLAGAKARAAFANQAGIEAFVTDLTTQIGSMRERIADLQGGAEAVARLKLAELSIVDPEEAKQVEGLIAELAGLERQYKGMQAAPRELKKEVRDLTAAAREQEGALDQLARITRSLAADVATPAQRAWMDYEDALADITEATDAAVAASQALGKEGKPLVEIFRQQDAAVHAAAIALDVNTASIERQREAQRQADDVVGNLLASLEEEARLASMTTEQRRVEEIVLRAVADAKDRVNQETGESLALGPAQVATLRQQVAGWQEVITAAHEARQSTQESQRAWTDFAGDLVDAMRGGMRGVKDLFKDMLVDLARQLLQSQVLRLMSSVFGSSMPGLTAAAGAGGQQSMLGALLGNGSGGGWLAALFGNGAGAAGSGNPGGLAGLGGNVGTWNGASSGGGSLFGGGMFGAGGTGMTAGGVLGAAGGVAMGLQGIRTGNALQGAAGGALAGMQIAGPWGALVGAIVGGLGALIHGTKEPDFRLGGSDASIRNREGSFSTVFGNVQAGSRQLSWESLVAPMQQFDSAIADLVNTMGGGQPQIDAITSALATWEVDLKGSAATAENVLGSRFNAVLGTFSTDVQTFVGTLGTVQERVGRLTDALAIEKIVDAGTLGDSFAEVSALLTDYRVGTEAIADTYARVLGSVTLLDQALALSGTSLDLTRDEMIRFAADIAEAAGGLQQAQALWSSYFETFYTADERAAFALQRAQTNAATQAGDIGLNASDFAGSAGAQAFRDLFESELPTLSAEAVVQWLEFAAALGVVLDLTGEASTSLADLMSGVTEQLAQYAPPMTFSERLQAIGAEMDALIATATELGASEAQLAQIRALGAAEINQVLEEQAAAIANYQSVVAGVRDELADARGLTEYQRELREVDRWLASTTASMNSAARAAGMQGAAEADLAMAHEVASIRASQAMARLTQRGRDLAAQLYGTALDQIDAQISEIGNGVSAWAGNVSDGMNSVTDATNQAVQAQIAAQQRIREWLDGIMATELSGLRPKDQLTEALALFERESAAAAGGDAEAAGRLPQLSDQILRLGQSVYGSSRGFFELRDLIIGRMRDLADLVIEDPVGTGGGGSSGGGNNQGFGQDALSAERERLAAEQNAAERRALAQELAAVIRDMTAQQEVPLAEIEATLGISMRDLVADLGVNLSDLTAATAGQLAGIAQAMGIELTDLAGSVGVDLGSLADRQSLLNDALEARIAALPAGQRAALESLLRDVERAAALGDTEGVEAGIASMEAAIAAMAPELRDALAPFFANIRPADPATELNHLGEIDSKLGSSLLEQQTQTRYLGDIATALTGTMPIVPGGFGPPMGPVAPPSFAVGTGFVPQDGLAYIHRGEMVFPAAVSEFFRREGIPLLAPPPSQQQPVGNGYAELIAEIRALRRENRDANAHAQRLEAEVRSLKEQGAADTRMWVAALERQTDLFKRGR